MRNREYGPCEISRSVRLFPQNLEIFVTFWNCNLPPLAAYVPGTLPRFIPGGKIEYCDFLQKIIKIRLNPSNIRSQFTQIFINELSDEQKLTIMCKSYLTELTDVTPGLVKCIVDFYTTIRNRYEGEFVKKLSNGTRMIPAYSLRTLSFARLCDFLNTCVSV